MKKILIYAFLIATTYIASASEKEKWLGITGSAYLENKSCEVLRRICDEAGGRLMGSENNRKAEYILIEELQKLGMKPRKETFNVPGWTRGNDSLVMLEPEYRHLRAAALGYTDKTAPFTAELVDIGAGYDENYEKTDAKGKIVLVSREADAGKEQPMRLECIEYAAKHGAKAILFTSTKSGGMLLASTADFNGKPSPIPAFSITFEEGKRLARLCEHNCNVKMTVGINSYCHESEAENIILTFPGKTVSKIIAGAHLDSWDLGQGSVDNGIGTAILFDMARLLSIYSRNNYFTVELVWLNGEELGLWGSRKYMEMHGGDSIIAMLNMDMTGSPTGFNACGFDEFKPFLDTLVQNLKAFNLKDGVTSEPWVNSDQQYFIMNGIPSFTPNAYLEKDMYWHYHDFGDTYDKVGCKFLSDAAAILSIFIVELSNSPALPFRKYSVEETVRMLKEHGLDKRIKRQKEWFYDIE